MIVGSDEAMAAVVTRLEAQDMEWRRLNVSHAFHSPLMEPVARPLEQLIGRGRVHMSTSLSPTA